jgi:hypothetical protein
MEPIFASAVAVVGTLLGVAVSHLLQQRQYRSADLVAREERRRSERVEAFSAFAENLMQFRRAQYDRWWRRHETANGMTPPSVRDESYRLRASAWHAFFRLKLLTDDTDLIAMAGEAIENAADIPGASSEEELSSRGDRARASLDAFVTAAALTVRDAT